MSEEERKYMNEDTLNSVVGDVSDIQVGKTCNPFLIEEISEEFPRIGKETLETIVKSLDENNEENDKELLKSSTRICLENNVTKECIDLLKIVFKEGLRSATKLEISIIYIDGQVVIDDNVDERRLSESDTRVLKEIITLDDEPEYYGVAFAEKEENNNNFGPGISTSSITTATKAINAGKIANKLSKKGITNGKRSK